METKTKAILELEWDEKVNFNIDEVINLAWKELNKCKKVDFVHRTNRTSYADLG